jgi:hypothetical protein
MNIKFIKLDTGADAALVVNDQIVASVDTSYDEDGSISRLESIAERLAEATGFGMQMIENHPAPEACDWSWDDVLQSMADMQAKRASERKRTVGNTSMQAKRASKMN